MILAVYHCYDDTVYHCADFPPQLQAKFQEGYIFTEPGFLSSSLQPRTALRTWPTATLLEIAGLSSSQRLEEILRSMPQKVINEAEVLFMTPGTKFFISSVQKAGARLLNWIDSSTGGICSQCMNVDESS